MPPTNDMANRCVSRYREHGNWLATARGKAHIVFGGASVYVTFDIDEIAPQYDATMNTAQVGAQMLFEIFALMTLNPDWQRGG